MQERNSKRSVHAPWLIDPGPELLKQSAGRQTGMRVMSGFIIIW